MPRRSGLPRRRQGVWLFHAVVYADPVAGEVADAFFAGLRLQQGAR